MKHSPPVLLAIMALSCAQAQSSYVGLQRGGVLGSNGPAPFAELQAGGPIADNVELRVAGPPLILIKLLQVDLLYVQELSDALEGYAGGGGDVLLLRAPLPPGLTFGVHATAGIAYRLGSVVGLFVEAQPILVVNEPEAERFFGKLNLGVNLHC